MTLPDGDVPSTDDQAGQGSDGFEVVLPAPSLGPDTMQPLTVNGRSVLVCRTGEGLFAIENRCAHAGETLTGGRLRAGIIACPHHGARFDLRDGRSLTPLTTKSLTRFPVREREGQIEVKVPPPVVKKPSMIGTPLGPPVNFTPRKPGNQ